MAFPLRVRRDLEGYKAPFPLLRGRHLMVCQDAWFGVGQIGEHGFDGHGLGHHDRQGFKSFSFHGRLDE